MKTTIVTIAIAVSTVFGFSNSSFAATRSTEEVTTLTEVGKISKIEVHGNVELYISTGSAQEVKVYNRYYGESAMVQDQNGVLRISSYAAQKLVVWVTAENLRKLSVYDNAEVKSFGKLSAIDLDVKLYNTASAQLNLDTYSTTISLNDKAKADVSGTVDAGAIHYDQSSYLNTTNLVKTHVTRKVNAHNPLSGILELVSL